MRMGIIQTIHQDPNHTANPVVLAKPLTSGSNHAHGCCSNHSPVLKPYLKSRWCYSNHICLSQTIGRFDSNQSHQVRGGTPPCRPPPAQAGDRTMGARKGKKQGRREKPAAAVAKPGQTQLDKYNLITHTHYIFFSLVPCFFSLVRPFSAP